MSDSDFFETTATEVEEEIVKTIGMLEEYNKYRKSGSIKIIIDNLIRIVPAIKPCVWTFVLQQLHEHNSDQYMEYIMGRDTATYKVNVTKVSDPVKSKSILTKIFKIF